MITGLQSCRCYPPSSTPLGRVAPSPQLPQSCAARTLASPLAFPFRLPAMGRTDEQLRSRASGAASASSSFELSQAAVDTGDDRERRSPGRHAFLHDFCMAIPYGMSVGVAGIVGLCFKQYNTGLILLGAAAAILCLAVLSLRTWSQQKDSRLFTIINAGVSAAVTATLWKLAPAERWALMIVRTAAGISGALLLFLAYNMLAGGNPPKGEKPAIEQECEVLETDCGDK